MDIRAGASSNKRVLATLGAVVNPAIPFIAALALVQPAVGLAQPSRGEAGTTAERTIPSKTYSSGRHAWVYKPSGYPASCHLIVAFDGDQYLHEMALPPILDSLIAAGRLPVGIVALGRRRSG